MEDDQQAIFDKIQKHILKIEKDIHGLLKTFPENHNTIKEYRGIYKRIMGHDSTDLMETTRKIDKKETGDLKEFSIERTHEYRTFYKNKTALQYMWAEQLKNYIQAYKKKPTKASFVSIFEIHETLMKYRPSNNNLSDPAKRVVENKEKAKGKDPLYPVEQIAKRRTALKQTRRLRNKQKTLKGLPEDWQILVANKIEKEYKFSVLIMSLMGCRPIELTKGVQLSIEKDGRLTCEILGAKYTNPDNPDPDNIEVAQNKTFGQAWGTGLKDRKIRFNPDPTKNVIAFFLKTTTEEVNKAKPGQPFILTLPGCQKHELEGLSGDALKDQIKAATNRFCKRVIVAGKKTPFKGISSLSFRHQAGSNFKGAGGFNSAKEVAEAMGHRSTKTQARYGQAGYATGGGKDIGIEEVWSSESEFIRDSMWQFPPEHRIADSESVTPK